MPEPEILDPKELADDYRKIARSALEATKAVSHGCAISLIKIAAEAEERAQYIEAHAGAKIFLG